MAKRNVYKEKTNPVYTVLYIVVMVLLIAVIVVMYRNYRIRKLNYVKLVEQASATDTVRDIASVKVQKDASNTQYSEQNSDLPENTDSKTESKKENKKETAKTKG